MGAREPTRIAVFCKAPVEGQVKTRLIPALGAARATAIYCELVERTLATVAATLAVLDAEATLWVAGDAAHPAIREWSRRFAMPLRIQHGADLGARMLHCLNSLTAFGGRALLVGTDCPALTRHDFAAADAALTGGCRWVFTPAEDGGYVLVGSSKPNATPFHNIAWSTSVVMEQTRGALAAAGHRWAEMPARWDIDEPHDVERAIAEGLLTAR